MYNSKQLDFINKQFCIFFNYLSLCLLHVPHLLQNCSSDLGYDHIGPHRAGPGCGLPCGDQEELL